MNHNPNKTSWRTAKFAGKANISPSCPVPSAACARMMCSFLFAAFVFCLQHSFFVCSVRFLFAAFIFCLQRFFYLQFSFSICSVSFFFAAFLFSLQRFFFVCSVTFLFAAFLFCLQRFFFVCSMSLVGHRTFPSSHVPGDWSRIWTGKRGIVRSQACRREN